jgi:hypothetical protein
MTKKSQSMAIPTGLCAVCGKKCAPHVTYTNNTEGEVFVSSVDMWPTYWRQIGDQRLEFCGCDCGNKWYNENTKKHKIG